MKWGIRKKLILLLIVATVLPFGTGIIITYYQTTNSINQNSVAFNYDLITKGQQELSSYLEDVAQMSSVLYRYTPFMNVMIRGVSDNRVVYEEEVKRALAYLFNSRTEIEQMHLYIDNGNDSYTNYHSKISGRGKNNNIYAYPYYEQLMDARSGYFLVEQPHEIYSYSQLSVIPESEKNKVLSFHSIIKNVPSDDFLGYLSIDINLSKIEGMANRLYTENAEDLYIMDDKDRIIFSSEKKKIGIENTEEWYEEIKHAKNKKSLEWEDRAFSGVIVFQTFSVDNYKWHIVKRIPYDVLYQSARETVWVNGFIALASLFIVLVITMVVSFKITAPIKILIENMKKVESGELAVDFESLGNDEIGMLGNHFKRMIAKINQLIEKEYKLEIENKASQLRVLRSQINPHFLYNSLQSIGTLALQWKAFPVYSLLTALSNIMRYSMNMREDTVPFTKELKHAKSYLLLQKQRFAEQFEFHMNISEEVNQQVVPKMILQPIVENCFKHGFVEQEKKALILLDVYLKDENLICVIEDNGKGVSEEELNRIKHTLFGNESKELETAKESIGLKNIYDRLQIYYHNKASMIITSKTGEGFSVTVKIPLNLPLEWEDL